MTLIRKTFPVTLTTKDADATGGLGSFLGAASVYNVIDLHGDVIDPGACSASLARKGDVRPLLWQHYMDRPIGTAKFAETGSALECEGFPVAGVPDAEAGMALVKAGAVTGLSIGFNILDAEYDGEVRHIKEIDLWEVSLVTFPANPLAQISSKGAHAALAELRAADAINELKAGRVLSAKNLGLVESCIDALQKLRDAATSGDDEGNKDSGTALDVVLENSGGADALAALVADIRTRH